MASVSYGGGGGTFSGLFSQGNTLSFLRGLTSMGAPAPSTRQAVSPTGNRCAPGGQQAAGAPVTRRGARSGGASANTGAAAAASGILRDLNGLCRPQQPAQQPTQQPQQLPSPDSPHVRRVRPGAIAGQPVAAMDATPSSDPKAKRRSALARRDAGGGGQGTPGPGGSLPAWEEEEEEGHEAAAEGAGAAGDQEGTGGHSPGHGDAAGGLVGRARKRLRLDGVHDDADEAAAGPAGRGSACAPRPPGAAPAVQRTAAAPSTAAAPAPAASAPEAAPSASEPLGLPPTGRKRRVAKDVPPPKAAPVAPKRPRASRGGKAAGSASASEPAASLDLPDAAPLQTADVAGERGQGAGQAAGVVPVASGDGGAPGAAPTQQPAAGAGGRGSGTGQPAAAHNGAAAADGRGRSQELQILPLMGCGAGGGFADAMAAADGGGGWDLFGNGGGACTGAGGMLGVTMLMPSGSTNSMMELQQLLGNMDTMGGNSLFGPSGAVVGPAADAAGPGPGRAPADEATSDGGAGPSWSQQHAGREEAAPAALALSGRAGSVPLPNAATLPAGPLQQEAADAWGGDRSNGASRGASRSAFRPYHSSGGASTASASRGAGGTASADPPCGHTSESPPPLLERQASRRGDHATAAVLEPVRTSAQAPTLPAAQPQGLRRLASAPAPASAQHVEAPPPAAQLAAAAAQLHAGAEADPAPPAVEARRRLPGDGSLGMPVGGRPSETVMLFGRQAVSKPAPLHQVGRMPVHGQHSACSMLLALPLTD